MPTTLRLSFFHGDDPELWDIQECDVTAADQGEVRRWLQAAFDRARDGYRVVVEWA